MYCASTIAITSAMLARSGTSTAMGSPGIGSPKMRTLISLPLRDAAAPPSAPPSARSSAESADAGGTAGSCGTSSRSKTCADAPASSLTNRICRTFGRAASFARPLGACSVVLRRRRISASRAIGLSSSSSSDIGGVSGLVESRCSSSRSSRCAAIAKYGSTARERAEALERSMDARKSRALR